MTLENSENVAKTLRLGETGPVVYPVGLGCMGMSGMYGPADEEESLRTIDHAVERGVSLLDTGDFYGMGHNELLLRRVLRERRERVQVSVKFGALRAPDGAFLGVDMRPAAVKTWAAYSLKRLGVDVIDVYRPARLDPNVPIEDTIGAIVDLIQAGYVRHIGLSEVGVETIRRAARVHPIVDLQIEYSLVSRGPEERIFPLLRELGISATLYGVYSRGLLTGSTPSTKGDFRGHLPRFSAQAASTNQAVVERLSRFASASGHSPAALLLAWALAKQPGFVPLVGARKREQLAAIGEALERPLTTDQVESLEALVPRDALVGERYGAEQMKQLDSER